MHPIFDNEGNVIAAKLDVYSDDVGAYARFVADNKHELRYKMGISDFSKEAKE